MTIVVGRMSLCKTDLFDDVVTTDGEDEAFDVCVVEDRFDLVSINVVSEAFQNFMMFAGGSADSHDSVWPNLDFDQDIADTYWLLTCDFCTADFD